MSDSDARMMTKTEARAWLKRVREDLRAAEKALDENDIESLFLAAQDAAAASCEVEWACTEQGVRGLGVYTN